MDAAALARELTDYAQTKLRENLSQIERCLNLLTPEQIWHRPNEASNAVGNLVLHLTGNVRQWIVAHLGGEPFLRDRPAEFAQRQPLPTGQIFEALQQTLAQANQVIARLRVEDLGRKHVIQAYEVSGLAAVFHVVEHFSLHTGQIVYATKLLTGKNLSLYNVQGQRLDGKASGVP